MPWGPILAWPLSACAVTAAMWVVVQAGLDQERLRGEANALDLAQTTARSYAAHVARTMEAVDQTLIHVRFEWELSRGALDLDRTDEERLFFPSTVVTVNIVGRDGRSITRTPDLKGVVPFAERPYFRHHVESGKDSLFISPPVLAQISRMNVVPFSRPLFDEKGKFDGIVLVSIYAGYFTESYDVVALGPNGFLGVAGTWDRTFRAVRVGNEVYSPTKAVALEMFPVSTSGGAKLLEGPEWFPDGHSRYLGWQEVPGYPLIAFSALDKEDALAPYRAFHRSAIRNATWASVGLLVFATLATVFSFRLVRNKRELAQMEAAYRLATEEGMDGFFILREMGGETGRGDFEIADCNAQGAKLLGVPRAALIGAPVSSLFPRPQYRRLSARLQTAMATGAYEDELPASSRKGDPVRWLHVKAIRSESQLAVSVTDVSEARAHLKELERRSNEDPLTRLPNRYWVQNYLPQAIARTLARQALTAVLFVDLDGFKKINDAIGHLAGDELLRQAAERLKQAVRPQDHVARLGGDEFVIVLEDIAEREKAAEIAQRALNAFEDGFHYQHRVHSISASIGISLCPTHGAQAETLLKSADIAMYAIKSTEKGKFRFFDERLLQALQERFETEMQLRDALKRDELVVYYQPRIDLASGRTSSVEALVRWSHPQFGLVSPNEFIPLAEETGLVVPLGKMVVEKVFEQVARWSSHETPLVPVSINVSARQLREVDVPKLFAEAFERYKIDPALIEAEITESSMIGEKERALEAIKALQGMGVKVLIDDFGMGYSSLSQLQEFDFDVLKIDRTFTVRGGRSEEGRAFLEAIITMAHTLGMRAVAEGVENTEQLDVLRGLNCDEAQGYLFSEPVPPAETQPVASSRALAAEDD